MLTPTLNTNTLPPSPMGLLPVGGIHAPVPSQGGRESRVTGATGTVAELVDAANRRSKRLNNTAVQGDPRILELEALATAEQNRVDHGDSCGKRLANCSPNRAAIAGSSPAGAIPNPPAPPSPNRGGGVSQGVPTTTGLYARICRGWTQGAAVMTTAAPTPGFDSPALLCIDVAAADKAAMSGERPPVGPRRHKAPHPCERQGASMFFNHPARMSGATNRRMRTPHGWE